VTWVFCHSSDEHYGADRILLDICDALDDVRLAQTEFWLPTDVEHGLNPLCEVLRRRGATVRHVDVPVLRRAYLRPRGLATLAGRVVRFRRALRRLRPTTVYCTTSATFLCAPVARTVGVRKVVGHVQEVWSGADSIALSVLARSCDRLVTISTAVRDALPDGLRRRAHVVMNATSEPGSWSPAVHHPPPLRFVMASRWNAWKGHRTLLEAWDRLDAAPGLLVLLGGPPPSGAVTDVRALVADLHDPRSVEVVGEVDAAGPYLADADVVLMPSDNPEPFGLVAVEAFARGRPVIGSDGGGLREIVTHGVDGWLFPARDSEALSRLLGSLTTEDVVAAGAAARDTYERRFTARRFAADWRAAVLVDE
jgi:glycosyltransferase involved in cell wall biosynthesis